MEHRRVITRAAAALAALILFGIAPTPAPGAAAPAAEAGVDADALAKHIVDTTGIARGVCSVPRAGDGKLALALAKSGLVVHAMAGDAAGVAAARKAAEGAGMLGRSMYVEDGSSAASPFADNYVNLLVIADATDKDLASLPAGEIVRVLVPGTGVAVVGLAKGAAGALTKDGLQRWTKGVPGGSAKVVDDACGLWAVVTKTPLAGAVAWTHRLFTPANNPVSTDTAAAWPLMTQWLGRPYLSAQPLTLIANGRMAAVRTLNWGSEAVFEMRDAHNGVLLWRRPLPDAAVATRTSGMVLMTDALYLAEGPDVLVLDPAGGKEIGRVACSELGGQVKWLAVQDGTLFAMAGPAEKPAMANQTWKVFGTPPAHFARCTGVGAFDLAARKWLWTHQATAESLDEGFVGLCGGRLYCYVADRGLACREARTGKVVWENPNVLEKVAAFKKDDFRGHIGALVCTDKFLALHKANCGTLVVSAASGEPLWSASAVAILFWRDLLVRKGGTNWGMPPAYDAASGKVSDALPKMSLGGGCGAFTLTPNLVCGQMGVTYDLKAGRNLDKNGDGPVTHKTPCVAGSFVGEGLVVSASVTCLCGYGVRGTVVQAPAASQPAGTAGAATQNGAPPAPRAVAAVAVAPPSPPAPLAADAADWPTFRANAARGNASAAKVPPAAAVRWTWPTGRAAKGPAQPEGGKSADAKVAGPVGPDPLDTCAEPVQATAAGGLVFVAGSDGVVTALDLATGAVRWRYVTAGRLFAPPTIADGRCFIGSGDGRVYCLEAASGRELWRYRVAPGDRRIMLYGDLVSTWPILSGVLVQDGVAYAAAGVLDVDGTHVVALDVRDGTAKWRNDTSGHLDSRRSAGVAACGYTAIGRGRLWLRTASYDLATGECRPWPEVPTGDRGAGDVERSKGMFQRYTGVFAGSFLVYGGRRFFDDQAIGKTDHDGDGAMFLELNDNATCRLPMAIPWQDCRTMPAWDDHNLLAMPTAHWSKPARDREEDLLCWDTSLAVSELHAAIAAGAKDPKLLQQWRKDQLKVKELDKAKGEKFEAPQQKWTAQSGWYVAAVLASNAAVAVHGADPKAPLPREHKITGADLKYTATAYDRSDGKVLWEVPLPGEPLMDGLSLARDGSILVRLLDGGLVCIGKSGP